MTTVLASYTDANAWLKGTSVAFVDDADALPEATNATTVVLARLYEAFPTQALLWTDPAHTPTLVKTITAMLMAAYRYMSLFATESPRRNTFAQGLEDRAMSMLDKVASGVLLLWDVTPLPSDASLTNQDFYPNDSTGLVDCDQQPMFTVRDRF